MQYLQWLVTSSSDPQKYAASFKGILMLGAAWILKALAITCGLALFCIAVDKDVLTSAIDTVGNVAYLALSLVGAMATLWGFGRKLWLGRWSAAPQAADGIQA
jgi:adenylosuccinate lyase